MAVINLAAIQYVRRQFICRQRRGLTGFVRKMMRPGKPIKSLYFVFFYIKIIVVILMLEKRDAYVNFDI